MARSRSPPYCLGKQLRQMCSARILRLSLSDTKRIFCFCSLVRNGLTILYTAQNLSGAANKETRRYWQVRSFRSYDSQQDAGTHIVGSNANVPLRTQTAPNLSGKNLDANKRVSIEAPLARALLLSSRSTIITKRSPVCSLSS